MQDQPHPDELIATSVDFLRREILPQMLGAQAFHLRVAINALELVVRQLAQAPAAEVAEYRRLQLLLGHDGSVEDLNRALCQKIATGEFGLETAGVREHLWATTLAKLAVDQPSYAAYKRELVETNR